MAYCKRNLLIKIIEIQTLVLKYKAKGGCFLDCGKYVVYTQVYLYHNFIKEQYHISYSTFNNYLARNAKKELADLENKKEDKQMKLF